MTSSQDVRVPREFPSCPWHWWLPAMGLTCPRRPGWKAAAQLCEQNGGSDALNRPRTARGLCSGKAEIRGHTGDPVARPLHILAP